MKKPFSFGGGVSTFQKSCIFPNNSQIFKFYLSFQINHKTHNWNKRQSLHPFSARHYVTQPLVISQGPHLLSPCLSVPASKDFLLFPDNIRHILIQVVSLAGLSIWKSYSFKPCVNCFLISTVSQRKSIHYSFSYYLLFSIPSQLMFLLSVPLSRQCTAKANMYHSRDLVKEHMGRIKTGSDLKTLELTICLVKQSKINQKKFPDYTSL